MSLFGVIDIITNFQIMYNINKGDMATTFTMLTELQNDIFVAVDKRPTTVNTIEFHDMCIHVGDFDFKFEGTCRINIGEMILLDGISGSGKSTVMNAIAGLYDGKVTESFCIDGESYDDEFRSISHVREYCRQDVLDGYKSNMFRTIHMTLTELFPNGTYDEIKEFLGHFGVQSKIPTDMCTKISKTQNGLCGGEARRFIVAVQVWRALKNGALILILDEPTREIDEKQSIQIFEYIRRIYHGAIILTLHEKSIKEHLDKWVSQTWQFADPVIGQPMTFTIHQNV